MTLPQSLIQGNARFFQGGTRPNSLAPSATATYGLICCSLLGSPEVIFDQPAGFLSVYQRAGLVIDDGTAGELEWAAQHEGVREFVVLQHHGCTVPGSACGDAAPYIERLREVMPEGCTIQLAELDADNEVRFID